MNVLQNLCENLGRAAAYVEVLVELSIVTGVCVCVVGFAMFMFQLEVASISELCGRADIYTYIYIIVVFYISLKDVVDRCGGV